MSGRDLITASAITLLFAMQVRAEKERRLRSKIADVQIEVLGQHSRQVDRLTKWAWGIQRWAFGDEHYDTRPTDPTSEARAAA